MRTIRTREVCTEIDIDLADFTIEDLRCELERRGAEMEFKDLESWFWGELKSLLHRGRCADALVLIERYSSDRPDLNFNWRLIAEGKHPFLADPHKRLKLGDH